MQFRNAITAVVCSCASQLGYEFAVSQRNQGVGMEFRNAIRFRDAADLPSQSVRFDYVYGFGGYDLSMGDGHLQYELEFDFYNR